MSYNTGLEGLANVKDLAVQSQKEKPFAGVLVYEQIAFILDAAQAALSRPSLVTCQRSLVQIEEMAREALIPAEKLLSPREKRETQDDVAAELRKTAKRRRGWCKNPTPIMEELEAELKREDGK